jgi:hypothetical protein
MTPMTRTSPLARHRLDPVALIFGLVFASVAAIAAADQLGWVHASSRAWGGAILVSLGVAGVAAVVSGAVRRRESATPVEP